METIFENKKQIKKSDIPIQIIRGILFLVGLYLFSKIRFINKETNPNITLIFGIALAFLFIYLILTDKTIKRIEKDTLHGKLTFTFERQLRNDQIKELNLSEIKVCLKKTQTRGSSKKVLHISDNENKLKLSTNQKGISESELNEIMKDIESTSHNNV